MNRCWTKILLMFALSNAQLAIAALPPSYAQKLCRDKDLYICLTVHRKDTWETLFPDPSERDIVMRINRTNLPLWAGMRLAIPKTLILNHEILAYAPLPASIETYGEKMIVISLQRLAFGAYDEQGHLIYWGPISGGRGWCSDLKRPCRTPIGQFAVYRKEAEECVSTKFPIPEGGAPMPYCMYFYRGFALHGSPEVPGYNASHGCVRMFTTDAWWLNQNFINVPVKNNNYRGTKIIVIPESELNPSQSEWTGL